MKRPAHENALTARRHAAASHWPAQAQRAEASASLVHAEHGAWDRHVNHSQRQLVQRHQLGAAFGPAAESAPIQRKSILEAVGRSGTDKIAVAGELHGEIKKDEEQKFWEAEGTKVVYENEIHMLKPPGSDAPAVPMSFDDCNERALYSLETLVGWIKDFDFRKKGIRKGEKCEAAGRLKRIIAAHVDLIKGDVASAKVELKNMIGFNAAWAEKKLPPRYSHAQVTATTQAIACFETLATKCLKTLSYQYVETDDLVAGLRMKKVGEHVDAAGAAFFKAKEAANVDESRLMSVARSESMFINLQTLGDMVSEKSIYKVGNKHAADMRTIPDSPVEIKTRDEYLKETGLIESPRAENITRAPADDMLGTDLIGKKRSKAETVKDKLKGL